ncbi:DUF2147 domain-containing protein [Mucilaginibacter paludis]|uniref:Uncharacterized protein n=1 Tax=Mucilaginibacter paludis DSM 18603 TaxID=714943 RepID=H1Y233_9SPHI|nr:hypothetical protein [Mucilaginibacter paludis]EHQ26690.1 hypothetical protein Mucpa_2575 [Mucilaginibacter paludis DSM 18603]
MNTPKKTGKILVWLAMLIARVWGVSAQKPDGDRIIGKWASEKKNLIVEVYKYGSNEYGGKIVWFLFFRFNYDAFSDKYNSLAS